MAGVKSNQGSKRKPGAGATQYDIHRIKQHILGNTLQRPEYLKAIGITAPAKRARGPMIGKTKSYPERPIYGPGRGMAQPEARMPTMGDVIRMENAIRAREKAGVENRSKAAEEYNKRFKPLPKTTTPRQRRPAKPFPKPPSRYP